MYELIRAKLDCGVFVDLGLFTNSEPETKKMFPPQLCNHRSELVGKKLK
jgi:hypothetical protein